MGVYSKMMASGRAGGGDRKNDVIGCIIEPNSPKDSFDTKILARKAMPSSW